MMPQPKKIRKLISVIIPAKNVSSRLPEVLTALVNQSYSDPYEILLIDNQSIDKTLHVAKRFPFVTALQESTNPTSPYSARNRGLERASGDVIAFLDATCVPSHNWLAEAWRLFFDNDVDLIAGKVRFEFSSEFPSAAELWDASTNIQQEQAVGMSHAKTANLFARREVIDRIGRFREGVRSGEDVRWTCAAVEAGFRLVYAPDVVVSYPARDWRSLTRKSIRTGAGKSLSMKWPRRVILGVGLMLVPPSPFRICRRVCERVPEYRLKLGVMLKLWFVAWSTRFAHGLGILFHRLLAAPD